ncbi:MAG: hypothetical protein C0599_05325 [Salinivirgaceae bacterium]|nr:MAG: hypothetical protein C0599_05325 [Salinivirgaceae bacterium]
MKPIRLLILILILGFANAAIAQQSVSGKVMSSDTNEPLPFVNIIGLQSKKGTTSGIDGNFSINLPVNETHLVFSAIGYKQDTIPVRTNMTILLKPIAIKLDEYVVTALGIKREKKSLGYAMTELQGDELQKNSEFSVIDKLAGRVAGLDISATNGGAGASSRIVLRGNNSITGDNQALIVVDGVPINNYTSSNSGDEWGGRDFGNSVSDINPDDIESISVLKGASASALYGSQAMDGVILITTKSGTARKGVGINFSSSTSFETPYIHYYLQNTYGAGRNGQFQGAWDVIDGTPVFNTGYDFAKGSWGPRMEGQTIIDWDGKERTFTAQPDNYRDFFRTGITSNNAIGIDGGNKKLTYRFSASNILIKDIVPESDIDRTNVGLNLNWNILSNLKLKTYINYARQKAENRPGLSDAHDNVNRNYIHMPRNISTESLRNYYKDADLNEVTWYENWSWMTNPFWNIEYQKNEDSRNRYFGNASLIWDATDKIKLLVRSAPDYYKTDAWYIDAQGGKIYGLGRYGESVDEHFLINTDFLATYSDSINKNWAYNVNIGGNSMYYKHFNRVSNTDGGLINPYVYELNNSVNPIYTRPYSMEAAKNSLYAFGQIAYKNYLFLDITGRNDWSSTLPENKNAFFYPSTSLSFVYSELINRKWGEDHFFSFGKFRLSYAGVGNDAEPYQLETTYEIIDNEGYGDMAFIDKTVSNLGLKPELVNSFEVGSEMKLFMNRLGLDVTYYDTRTHNQISIMPVSATSGYSHAIINSGIIKNNGWELQINATPIETKSFKWDINIGYAKNRSEVLKLAPNVESAILYSHWRLNIEARPGHAYGDIVGYGFQRDENGNILVDANGMVLRDENPKVLGNVKPDFTLTYGNTLTYKNLSLYFMIQGKIGGDMFSGTNMYGNGYAGNFEESLEGRAAWYQSEQERIDAGVTSENWTPTGGYLVNGIYAEGTTIDGVDVSGENNQSYINPYDYYYKVSLWQEEIHEPFIYDASFVKLREVSLTYKLPKKFVNRFKLKGASFGVYGTNLWLIYSKVPNIDPETMLTNGNGQGYELYSYPNPRSIGFRLTINI